MGKKRKNRDSLSQPPKKSRHIDKQDTQDVPVDATSVGNLEVTDKTPLPTTENSAQSSSTEDGDENNGSNVPPAITNALSRVGPLIPPLADDASIRKTHDIHVLAIVASSKIETKVRQAISLLKEGRCQIIEKDTVPDISSRKKILVALVARAPAANKCVSVIEIVKREFCKEKDAQLFQYTAMWMQLEDYQPRNRREDPSHGESTTEGLADEEPNQGKHIVRNTSCLAVYLACQSVFRLKESYAYVSEGCTCGYLLTRSSEQISKAKTMT